MLEYGIYKVAEKLCNILILEGEIVTNKQELINRYRGIIYRAAFESVYTLDPELYQKRYRCIEFTFDRGDTHSYTSIFLAIMSNGTFEIISGGRCTSLRCTKNKLSTVWKYFSNSVVCFEE